MSNQPVLNRDSKNNTMFKVNIKIIVWTPLMLSLASLSSISVRSERTLDTIVLCEMIRLFKIVCKEARCLN